MTMRSISLIVFATGLFISVPVLAGTVNVTDGQGAWQSTKCTKPEAPLGLSNNPEIPANELNEKMAVYNKYVVEAQEYMACISREAQADAEASNQTILRTAQAVIQQTQEQVNSAQPRPKR